MPDIIYLEPDEEITKVIDRLKASRSDSVVFVIARGSSLAQSIVNLKILKRSAEELDKIISLVTNDRITQNIASQINLAVYSKVIEAEKAQPRETAPAKRPVGTESEKNGAGEAADSNQFRVNTYRRYDGSLPDEVEQIESRGDPEGATDYSQDGDEEKDYRLRETGDNEHHQTEGILPGPMPVGTDYYRGGAESENISRQSAESKLDEREGKVIETNKDNETEAGIMAPILTSRARHRNIQGSRKPFLVVAGIILVIVLTLGYIFVPTASLVIGLATADYKDDFLVTVDKSAATSDTDTLTAPGTLLELEKEISKDFVTSGKKDAGTKATGKITVQNNYDTNTHKYPKGSRFTANGKTYLSDDLFTVKPATITLVGGNPVVTSGEVEVAVTAEKSGDSYNSAAAAYVLEGAPAKITGKGGEMAGGLTKEIGIVLDKDLDEAETAIKKEALDQASRDLNDKAGAAGAKLAESSISSEIISVTSTAKVDDEADNFKYTAKTKVFGLSFKESDVRSVVMRAAAGKIGSAKMVVGTDRANIIYTAQDYDNNQGKLKLKASLTGKIGQRYSGEEIGRLVKGKSAARAEAILKNREGIEDTSITLWPNFAKRVPMLAKRIEVKFDYNE